MKRKIKILLLISFVLISIQISSFARYYDVIGKIKGRATIAEPIVKVEKLQDTIIAEINKKSQPIEYYFVIKKIIFLWRSLEKNLCFIQHL